ADRISKEAIYKEVRKSDVDYGVVLQDPLIRSLTDRYVNLESEYFNLLQVHKPEYPKMIRLREQMEKLKETIGTQEQKIINTLSSDYQLALKKEKFLIAAIEKLRNEVSNLQDKIVQIQILKREVDTNSELYNALLQRLKEVGVSAALTESNVQVLDRAQVPRSPFKPKKGFNAALSLILGLFGGVFLAFFVEYFDQTIRTPQDVEKWSRLPVIGMVPLIKDNLRESSSSVSDNTQVLTESFRSIGTWIKFANSSVKPRQILVTSPLEGEGKTLVSINTAMSLLNVVGKGVIIDADFRRPCVHTSLDLDNSTGLSSFLSGTSEFDQLIKKSSVTGLDVITSGPMPHNPSEVLNSDRMRELMDALSAMYDFIVIDSAPLLGLSDSLILSASVDSVMLVVKSGQTPKDALIQSNKVLLKVATKILGVVLNGTDIKKKYGYSYCHTSYGNDKQVKKIPFIIKAS
ncbi:MAG: polysaccharide biosynthesis tyrosine autokinase, partial [Nitrospiraceae bacterium]